MALKSFTELSHLSRLGLKAYFGSERPVKLWKRLTIKITNRKKKRNINITINEQIKGTQ